MSVDTINIFLSMQGKELLLGKLLHKDRVIYFEYDRAFLRTGIEISPYKLPLKDR